MEILKGIEIKNKALWLKKERILVIGDLHLGYEQSLNEQGILIPRKNFDEIFIEIKNLLKLKPKKIIILGDLKHEFGNILKQEGEDVIKLVKKLSKCSDLLVIRGNHDGVLFPLLKKENVSLLDEYFFKDFCFLHGHKIPESLDFKKSKIIIIGHEHPAIELGDGIKKEKYKCFLLGRFKNKKLVVLPSFFPILGVNILKEKPLSPFLKKDLGNFSIFVIYKKPYFFGKLKNIRKLTN